jgi:hypothetical protein
MTLNEGQVGANTRRRRIRLQSLRQEISIMSEVRIIQETRTTGGAVGGSTNIGFLILEGLEGLMKWPRW